MKRLFNVRNKVKPKNKGESLPKQKEYNYSKFNPDTWGLKHESTMGSKTLPTMAQYSNHFKTFNKETIEVLGVYYTCDDDKIYYWPDSGEKWLEISMDTYDHIIELDANRSSIRYCYDELIKEFTNCPWYRFIERKKLKKEFMDTRRAYQVLTSLDSDLYKFNEDRIYISCTEGLVESL